MPSAIVMCARTASRSVRYRPWADMAGCIAATTSLASQPRYEAPRDVPAFRIHLVQPTRESSGSVNIS